jgi:predicted methyltransferase
MITTNRFNAHRIAELHKDSITKLVYDIRNSIGDYQVEEFEILATELEKVAEHARLLSSRLTEYYEQDGE